MKPEAIARYSKEGIDMQRMKRWLVALGVAAAVLYGGLTIERMAAGQAQPQAAPCACGQINSGLS